MSIFHRPSPPPNQRSHSADGGGVSDRVPSTHPSQSQAAILTTTADIAPARDRIESWLRANAPQVGDARIADIVLAASELFCNAFEHGTGGCLFDMSRSDSRLTLTVSNDASHAQLLPTDWWIMPDVTERSGRGLAIVQAVADSVRLITTTTSVSIAATFDLQTPPPVRTLAASFAI